MNNWEIVNYWVLFPLLIIAIDTIVTYVRLWFTIRYLEKTKKKLVRIQNNKRHVIHILISVLREVSIIEKCVKNFSNLKGLHTIHFVTTEKEAFEDSRGRNFTREKLEDLNERYHHFRIIHYPRNDGVMSHQLNYAFDKLIKDGVAKDADYILVYNADTSVDEDAIVNMSKFLTLSKTPSVVHQPSVFLSNYSNFCGWQGPFLRNIALLQSRWTFVHEIPRILLSSKDNALLFGLYPFFQTLLCLWIS